MTTIESSAIESLIAQAEQEIRYLKAEWDGASESERVDISNEITYQRLLIKTYQR